MFTRRSILELIKAWVECDVISLHPQKSNTSVEKIEERLHVSRVQPILNNGAEDFDWETRRKCTDIIRAAFVTIRSYANDVRQVGESLQCLCDVFNETLAKLVRDCEYKVKLELVYCLQELKTSAMSLLKGTSGILDSMEPLTMDVGTFESFEFFMRNDMRGIKTDRLCDHLRKIDFDAVTKDLKEMDDTVRHNPCSFLEDIIASAEQKDENLLDCY